MDDAARSPTLPPVTHVPDLRVAIRRARLEDAERTSVVTELRGSEVARLEALQSALQPVLAQVPQGVDLFDVGISGSERPRLFVDMVAFVEMGRDRRTYRLVKDTREGRTAIAESDQLGPILDAVTAYVARRLVEREKALAVDTPPAQAAAEKPPAAPRSEMPRQEAGLGEFLFTFIAGAVSSGVVLYALIKLKLLAF
jgi:hypothetical protein